MSCLAYGEMPKVMLESNCAEAVVGWERDTNDNNNPITMRVSVRKGNFAAAE